MKRVPSIDHACSVSADLDFLITKLRRSAKPLTFGNADDIRDLVDSIRVEAYEAGIRDGQRGVIEQRHAEMIAAMAERK